MDMASAEEEERSTSPFAYDLAAQNGSHTEPIACQQAKRACDRQRPCKACTERKTTDKCKYASDASEPVDTRWLHKKISVQDNLITALYNSLGIAADKREAIAQSQQNSMDLRFEIPLLENRTAVAAGEKRIPTICGPSSHLTVFSQPPSGFPVDLATLVFASNSIFVPLDELMGPWSETLGLHFRALPIRDSKILHERDKDDNTFVHLTATHSELEPRNWNKSLNFSALALAHKLFVAPLSDSNGPGPLITPKHVSYLPSSPLREELWTEFESMMVLSSGLVTKELKKRVDNLFLWAEWGRSSEMESEGVRPAPPTAAFFATVCAAYAIGAQSRECQAAHRAASQGSGTPGELSEQVQASKSAETPSGASTTSSSPTWPSEGSERKDPFGTTSYSAQDFHNLFEATRLVHDQLELPPSLDYIQAHIFSWIYLLHPSNATSLVSDTTSSIHGGGPIGVDGRIWKEIGKVVNVARAMGLGVDPDTPMAGGEVHGMGIWEKEMRRRVWWELCGHDAYISECMGQPPLIDPPSYSCKVPTDVDEGSFGPTSKSLPPPNGSSTNRNLSHFVQKCMIIQIAKNLKRYSASPIDLETSVREAREYEKEILTFKAGIPTYLQIKGLPCVSNESHTTSPQIIYPSTDIMTMQACHLYTMANSLIVRLWMPFLLPTLDQPHVYQWPPMACATAANAVVIACDYLRNQLRDVRPANLGHFVLGRSVFAAGCAASAVVIRGGPDLFSSETALKTIKTAIHISRDPTVCGLGRPNDKSLRFEAGRVLDLLYLKADNTWKQNQTSVGSKRKESDGPRHEVLKLRAGFELPYAGRGVVTTSCTLHLNYNPVKTSSSSMTFNHFDENDSADQMIDFDGSDPRSPSSRPPPRASWDEPRSAITAGSETDERTSTIRPPSSTRSRRRTEASAPPSQAESPSASSAPTFSRAKKTKSSEVVPKTSNNAKPKKKASQDFVAPQPKRSSASILNKPLPQEQPQSSWSTSTPMDATATSPVVHRAIDQSPTFGGGGAYSSSDTDNTTYGAEMHHPRQQYYATGPPLQQNMGAASGSYIPSYEPPAHNGYPQQTPQKFATGMELPSLEAAPSAYTMPPEPWAYGNHSQLPEMVPPIAFPYSQDGVPTTAPQSDFSFTAPQGAPQYIPTKEDTQMQQHQHMVPQQQPPPQLHVDPQFHQQQQSHAYTPQQQQQANWQRFGGAPSMPTGYQPHHQQPPPPQQQQQPSVWNAGGGH